MNNQEIILKSEQIKEFINNLPKNSPFGEELIKNSENSVIISRTITSEEMAKKAELHENYTDVFLVKEGEEEFFIGGEIIDKIETKPGEWRGFNLNGARKYNIKKDDIVIIPKAVPHRHGIGQIKMIVIKVG